MNKFIKDERGSSGTMDGDFVNWALGGCMTVIGFFTKRTMGEIDALHDKHKDCELGLSEFKTEVAKNYSTRDSVISAFKMVKDEVSEVKGDVRDMRNDIKELIGRK